MTTVDTSSNPSRKIYGVIVLVILLIAAGRQSLKIVSFLAAAASKAPSMTIEDAKKLPKKSTIWLDARQAKEYHVSHLPEAQLVDPQSYDIDALPLDDWTKKTIVVYCSVGYRSGKVAEALQARGLSAYNLKGGIFMWAHRDLPMVDQEENPTHKVHGYSRLWAFLVRDGNAILR